MQREIRARSQALFLVGLARSFKVHNYLFVSLASCRVVRDGHKDNLATLSFPSKRFFPFDPHVTR